MEHVTPTPDPSALVLVDAGEWAAVRREIADTQALVRRVLATLADALPRLPRSHRHTRAEAANRLRVGLSTLDALIGAPDGFGAVLHAQREGRAVFVTEGAVLDYLERLDADAERRAAGRSRRRSPLAPKGEARAAGASPKEKAGTV